MATGHTERPCGSSPIVEVTLQILFDTCPFGSPSAAVEELVPQVGGLEPGSSSDGVAQYQMELAHSSRAQGTATPRTAGAIGRTRLAGPQLLGDPSLSLRVVDVQSRHALLGKNVVNGIETATLSLQRQNSDKRDSKTMFMYRSVLAHVRLT